MTARHTTAPVLCLAGPTASGKSALALELAQQHGGVEIISVDSALIYRGMDIGTAKPSAQELRSVPHHLIDTHEPIARYSAAQFARDAHELVGEIRGRGHVPVLVGGTMLYVKALADGLHDLPPADSSVRAAIETLAAQQGWPAVHAELARVDTQSASRLQPHDAQRVQRALEVYRMTGKPISVFYQQAAHMLPPLALALYSLEAPTREWLHTRIALRTQQMLAAGLIDEVRGLMARGDLHVNLPSMRCVGYRQCWNMLQGELAPEELETQITIATRQLAKRQMTWLRSMTARTVLDASDPRQALATLQRALSAAH